MSVRCILPDGTVYVSDRLALTVEVPQFPPARFHGDRLVLETALGAIIYRLAIVTERDESGAALAAVYA